MILYILIRLSSRDFLLRLLLETLIRNGFKKLQSMWNLMYFFNFLQEIWVYTFLDFKEFFSFFFFFFQFLIGI